jgi:hypothetical protein
MKHIALIWILFLGLSNLAHANHAIRELDSAIWLRPQTHLLNELCELAKQDCNVTHYSIDPLTDTQTPLIDDFKTYFTDYSVESFKSIPLENGVWKKQLIHLMKEAGVEKTSEAKHIFNEIMKSLTNIQDGFSPKFLGGISYFLFNQHEYLFLIITNPRYQTSEVLVFSVLRKE